MSIVQRIIFKPQTYFQKFVSTLILSWGIAAIVPLYFRIQDLWGYGKVNGPMSSPFIFQFFLLCNPCRFHSATYRPGIPVESKALTRSPGKFPSSIRFIT